MNKFLCWLLGHDWRDPLNPPKFGDEQWGCLNEETFARWQNSPYWKGGRIAYNCRRCGKKHFLNNTLLTILERTHNIMATMQEVLDLVRDETTIENSIVTLLTELKAKVDAANGNQTLIDEAFNELTTNKTTLTAALTANTVTEDATAPATE